VGGLVIAGAEGPGVLAAARLPILACGEEGVVERPAMEKRRRMRWGRNIGDRSAAMIFSDCRRL